MTNKSTRPDQLGKNPGVAALILSSLAGGEKHGYALVKDVAGFAGVELAPGTLYEALARLERLGLIELLPPTTDVDPTDYRELVPLRYRRISQLNKKS